MAFAVKVDEDLPRSAVKLLREHGYDALSVVDQGMGGWKDPSLWVVIQKETRFLVTAIKALPIFENIRQGVMPVFCSCGLTRTESAL